MKNYIFDGCDTTQLAKKYGTPLYVVSESAIRKRCQTIQNDFLKKYSNTKAMYAAKAFLPLAMCKIIADEGLGLDIVSGGELYTAIKAGFPLGRIEFNGNNKSYQELEMAIDHRIGRIIVDNLHELEMIHSICCEKNTTANILFRIVPETETATHEYISTGHKSSKFGVALDQTFFEIFEKAIQFKTIHVKGIHFHIGSQLHDHNSHLMAVQKTLHLMDDLNKKFNYTLEELNIGGGFGIQYLASDPVKPLSYFIDPVMTLIESYCLAHDLMRPQVIIEPGRWIIGEAGITLYSIGSIKQNGHTKYASIDGGMSDNIRPSLYQAKYHAVLANKMDQAPSECITISGKFCESSDILIKEIMLPKVESGDLLAVFSTGAYNYSMANNYNKILIPPVVLVAKGLDHLIVLRQTFENLLINDCLPKHLEAL